LVLTTYTHVANMLTLLGVAALLGSVYAQNASLPQIDLGYEIYRAAGFNVRVIDPRDATCVDMEESTGNFYSFSNIRYAAPPVGNLRFAAPQPPARNRSAVNNGGTSRYAKASCAVTHLEAPLTFVESAHKPVQRGTR
jgi:acetylcholinesterase